MSLFDSLCAPQYSSFHDDDNDNDESYFEIDHEKGVPVNGGEIKPLSGENVQEEEDQEFFSPMKKYTPAHSRTSGYCLRNRQIRRSISCDSVHIKDAKAKNAPKVSVENLKKTFNNLRLTKTQTEKQENQLGAQCKSRSLRSSRETVNRLAQPKKKFSSIENVNANEYICMAEAVKKFHSGTPVRFRSRPTKEPLLPKLVSQVMKNTIPQSPALTTKTRSRPTHILSQDEKEKKEFEEVNKFKIKAHPVNKKMLQGPLKPIVAVHKSPTKPEPFKLTQIPKKELVEEKVENKFHARPVPKQVIEGSKLKPAPKIAPTIPETPTFVRRIPKASPIKMKPSENKENFVPKRTDPQPFSFEERNKRLMKQKEEYINRFLEEEKKKREFHAKPIPKCILAKSSRLNRSLDSDFSSANSVKSEENYPSVPVFKARPPTVLYTKPFEPKKVEHYIEIKEFQLNSDQRAKEREEFNRKQQEKELCKEQFRKLEEERRRLLEEEEKARLRKTTEIKANPIKKYKEIKICPSNKVTQPKSPNFASKKMSKSQSIELAE